jgi:hypothetical protein
MKDTVLLVCDPSRTNTTRSPAGACGPIEVVRVALSAKVVA